MCVRKLLHESSFLRLIDIRYIKFAWLMRFHYGLIARQLMFYAHILANLLKVDHIRSFLGKLLLN